MKGTPIGSALLMALLLVVSACGGASWSYFTLIKKLRAQRYDLAIDVSGSRGAQTFWLKNPSCLC